MAAKDERYLFITERRNRGATAFQLFFVTSMRQQEGEFQELRFPEDFINYEYLQEDLLVAFCTLLRIGKSV